MQGGKKKKNGEKVRARGGGGKYGWVRRRSARRSKRGAKSPVNPDQHGQNAGRALKRSRPAGQTNHRPRIDEGSVGSCGARTPHLAEQVGGGGAPLPHGRLRYPLETYVSAQDAPKQIVDGCAEQALATGNAATAFARRKARKRNRAGSRHGCQAEVQGSCPAEGSGGEKPPGGARGGSTDKRGAGHSPAKAGRQPSAVSAG